MERLDGNKQAAGLVPTQSSDEEEYSDIFGETTDKSMKMQEKGLSQKEFISLKQTLTSRLKPLLPVSFR